MSRPANPPREELLAVGAFVKARMAEATALSRAGRYTDKKLPEPVQQVVEAAHGLVQARALWAEMAALMDPKDNRVRALAAPLYELAEQWKEHPDYQLAWQQRQLTGITAQPTPAKRTRTPR
ncbi:hypothetical protein AB0O64_23485 [Streptomyces sp. NPDC088341]|uniref:hypothetical protein n=1 Tax=Streptomyces sp. NPDC088341 TaxID=3154870 RepID=UPI00343CE2D7